MFEKNENNQLVKTDEEGNKEKLLLYGIEIGVHNFGMIDVEKDTVDFKTSTTHLGVNGGNTGKPVNADKELQTKVLIKDLPQELKELIGKLQEVWVDTVVEAQQPKAPVEPVSAENAPTE